MSNATTVTTTSAVEEESVSAFSDKTIDYLIRTATEGSATPEETYRKLIEATVEATQRKRKRPRATELATNYAIHNTALVERINEAREVAANTMRKMTHETPDDLKWANYRSGTLRILGIYRNEGGFGSTARDIQHEIANGKKESSEFDIVKFEITYNNTKVQGELPLRMLTGDPMKISQYIRSRCKGFHAQQEREEAKRLADEQKSLDNQLSNLKKQMAAVEARRARNAKATAPKVPKPDSRVLANA